MIQRRIEGSNVFGVMIQHCFVATGYRGEAMFLGYDTKLLCGNRIWRGGNVFGVMIQRCFVATAYGGEAMFLG